MRDLAGLSALAVVIVLGFCLYRGEAPDAGRYSTRMVARSDDPIQYWGFILILAGFDAFLALFWLGVIHN
ncbi:hypothetical protein ACO2Q3_11630 [Caulobacter sp. KR2-114]|uniref:hypothetical protein n=1 Tax=Caulobacter sp. KR2-114 TaxID=3400912 RepID=UPI003C020B2A